MDTGRRRVRHDEKPKDSCFADQRDITAEITRKRLMGGGGGGRVGRREGSSIKTVIKEDPIGK